MSQHGQRGAVATFVALLVALVVGLSATPAQAASELQLSADGVTWSNMLPQLLFPEQIVPGDVDSASLWLRNASADDARVELHVASGLGSGAGTFTGALSLTVDGTPVAGGAVWTGPVLPPGGSVEIPLVLSFAADAPPGTRASVSAVLSAALLRQTAPGTGPGTDPTAPGTDPTVPGTDPAAPLPAPPAQGSTGSGGGGLAHTGADVGGVLGGVVLLVGAGLLLLAVRRRARRTPADPGALRDPS